MATLRPTLIATVHHGGHRATATRPLPFAPVGHAPASAILEALEDIREHPEEGIGAYAPTNVARRTELARELARTGQAEHGWVRYSVEKRATTTTGAEE